MAFSGGMQGLIAAHNERLTGNKESVDEIVQLKQELLDDARAVAQLAFGVVEPDILSSFQGEAIVGYRLEESTLWGQVWHEAYSLSYDGLSSPAGYQSDPIGTEDLLLETRGTMYVLSHTFYKPGDPKPKPRSIPGELVAEKSYRLVDPDFVLFPGMKTEVVTGHVRGLLFEFMEQNSIVPAYRSKHSAD
jgi:hypothetical protein